MILALQRLQSIKTGGDAHPTIIAVTDKSKFNSKKSHIYKLIANEMDDWRRFGRELNIPESTLTNLDRIADIPTIIHRILEFAEERHSADNMLDQLINALTNSKRKDVVKEMKIMLAK